MRPFGYTTKTIRDKEFFTAGDIAGDCIGEAVIVDKPAGIRMPALTRENPVALALS